MNFWAVSSMPVHRLDRRMKKKAPADVQTPPNRGTQTMAPSTVPSATATAAATTGGGVVTSSPVVAVVGDEDGRKYNGPRLRGAAALVALHKKHQSYSSASSSSLLTSTTDAKSWEHTLETLSGSLSRKSSASGRSTTSSMPTRERPESVQMFGRTIFNRRKSGVQSTSPSGSSLSSADDQPVGVGVGVGVGSPSPSHTHTHTHSHSHSHSHSPAVIMSPLFGRRRTRLRISEPYNFQHTCGLRSPQDGKEQDVPSETPSRNRPPVRTPPPRPPRSPVASTFECPPMPPVRSSSRSSVRRPDVDSTPEPRRTSDEARCSRIISCDDADWPLPCSSLSSHVALPNVPEEDENALTRQGRANRGSVASNHSSLRWSQSVPVLRKPSLQKQQKQHRRSSSGASESLGRSELFAAQRRLQAAMQEREKNSVANTLPRESWEDDIDYCYEHAVEADCDYAWERPSLDLGRDDEGLQQLADVLRQAVPCGVALSPGLPAPASAPLPGLLTAEIEDDWPRSSFLHLDSPPMGPKSSLRLRASASTVASRSSHTASSSGTDSTRITSPSSPDGSDGSSPKDELMTAAQERESFVLGHAWTDRRNSTMPPLPEHESSDKSKPTLTAGFGSEPNLLRWAAEQAQKQQHVLPRRPRKDSLTTLPTVRRPRARTTSLSRRPLLAPLTASPSVRVPSRGV